MAYAIDTRCIHGEGHKNQDGNYAISYPIYQTASFSHLTPGHNPTGFDYSRESNPTRAYLEETLSSARVIPSLSLPAWRRFPRYLSIFNRGIISFAGKICMEARYGCSSRSAGKMAVRWNSRIRRIWMH